MSDASLISIALASAEACCGYRWTSSRGGAMLAAFAAAARL